MVFSVDTATEAVIDSFEHTPDERLRTLLADSDAVFAVKRSLIIDFQQVNDQTLADDYGVEPPFRHARADFGMMAEA